MNEWGKAAGRPRQVSIEEMSDANRRLMCRKLLDAVETGVILFHRDEPAGSLVTAQVAAGIEAA